MATAYTKADSLAVYLTVKDGGADGLGGSRSALEVANMGFVVDTPIPQIAIVAISGENGAGEGLLNVSAENTLTWTPPGDTVGAGVAIAANETKLIEGSDPDKWIRVHWDGDYSSDSLGGQDSLTLCEITSAEDVATQPNSYAGLMLTNHNVLAQDVTSVKVWIGTLGTQRITNTAQLGGSGSGTITTTGSFADWPATGWAHIKNAGTTREIVYYTSRTATSLTVPSGGRGLLGTSASAGAGTDTVDAVPGIRIAKEAQGSDGRIQEIANVTTAPSGVTWSTAITSATGLTEATLASNANLGLWVHIETPAVAEAIAYRYVKFLLEYVVGGVTYSNRRVARYNVRNTSLERWEVHAGTDANPTFTTPSATSATLPITYALTPPGAGLREYRVTVRKRNAFNLASLNTYYRSFTIDSAGALIGGTLTGPQNTTLTNVGAGKLRIESYYPIALDASPADTWLLYVTTDGATPDPDVDSPIPLGAIGSPDMLTGRVAFTMDTAALPWNTTFKMILRVQRSGDSAESTNLDVVTAVVDSGNPPYRNLLPTGGSVYNWTPNSQGVQHDHETTPDVFSYTATGQTYFSLDGTIIWRATLNDKAGARIFINNLLTLKNTAISGSGTGDVEVVDADTVYLCVAGERRVLIDLNANTIEAVQFIYNGTIDDNQKAGPVDTDNGKLYLSVYNPSRNAWEPYLQVDSDGVVTFGYSVVQKET